MTAMTPKPLAGLRVLDLTTVLAGPYCTYQLGLMGAEVIKVERPGGGDWARNGLRVEGVPDLSAQFVAQNAGKKSMVLNLKTEEGRRIALDLAQGSDILVENFSPGVAGRLGLGFDDIRARRGDIVYCSLSGYGQTGDMSRRPAYDHVVQAASGITTLIGTRETVPNRIGPPLFDYLAGAFGAMAVLGALHERNRTGQAQYLDVAMLDVALVTMASTVSNLINGGRVPQPNGNVAASGSPASGVFETREGLLAMTANQEGQIVRLCAALGLDALMEDERYATPDARLAHAASFRERVAAVLKDRSAREWEAYLSGKHLPATRVRTLPDVLGEPHVAAREVQKAVEDPETGRTLSVPSAGFRWNGQALEPGGPPPRLGQHTAELLGGLGLDEQAVAALRERGVI